MEHETMTLAAWQAFAKRTHDRADVVSSRLTDKARREATRVGLDGSMPGLTAHNCLVSKPGTGWAAQCTHKDARRVQYMLRQAGNVTHLASRIVNRAWKRVSNA